MDRESSMASTSTSERIGDGIEWPPAGRNHKVDVEQLASACDRLKDTLNGVTLPDLDETQPAEMTPADVHETLCKLTRAVCDLTDILGTVARDLATFGPRVESIGIAGGDVEKMPPILTHTN